MEGGSSFFASRTCPMREQSRELEVDTRNDVARVQYWKQTRGTTTMHGEQRSPLMGRSIAIECLNWSQQLGKRLGCGF